MASNSVSRQPVSFGGFVTVDDRSSCAQGQRHALSRDYLLQNPEGQRSRAKGDPIHTSRSLGLPIVIEQCSPCFLRYQLLNQATTSAFVQPLCGRVDKEFARALERLAD